MGVDWRAGVRNVFELFGLNIGLLNNSPRHNLLGLRSISASTILDVGANEGQFSKLARHHFPTAKIFSFEPLPEPFQKLCAVVEKDRNMMAVNVALGSETGTQTFLRHVEHSQSSSFLTSTPQCHTLYPQTQDQGEVTVEVTTLDAWMSGLREPLQPEILIKLDVQGYEDRVIAGGGQAFGQAAACILEVGLDPLYEGQADFFDLVDRLRHHGLEYAGNLDQAYAPDGHVVYLDAVFLRRRR